MRYGRLIGGKNDVGMTQEANGRRRQGNSVTIACREHRTLDRRDQVWSVVRNSIFGEQNRSGTEGDVGDTSARRARVRAIGSDKLKESNTSCGDLSIEQSLNVRGSTVRQRSIFNFQIYVTFTYFLVFSLFFALFPYILIPLFNCTHILVSLYLSTLILVPLFISTLILFLSLQVSTCLLVCRLLFFDTCFCLGLLYLSGFSPLHYVSLSQHYSNLFPISSILFQQETRVLSPMGVRIIFVEFYGKPGVYPGENGLKGRSGVYEQRLQL